jgi:hypothetical protein
MEAQREWEERVREAAQAKRVEDLKSKMGWQRIPHTTLRKTPKQAAEGNRIKREKQPSEWETGAFEKKTAELGKKIW